MKTAFTKSAGIWTIALAVGGSMGAMIPTGSAMQPVDVTTVGARRVLNPVTIAARYVLAPEGNEARYRVRERLAGRDLDNDAVGVTKAVTGTILLDDAGRIVRDSSRFTVDLATLVTDSERRDGYVRRNTLEVAKFPTASFVPFQLLGLPAGMPASGSFSFQIMGELTLHGVSRLTTWNVTARASGTGYAGTAITQFKFVDFQMSQPRVPVVLSVKDSIQLEYDFRLIRATP